MIKKILMFVVMSWLLMSCGNRDNVRDTLIGKTYALNEKVLLEDEGYEVAFTITFDQGKLSGRALNNYNSSYVIKGNNIEISPMATTLMAGPEKLMRKETLYFKDITNAKTIILEDNILTITTIDNKALVFTEIK